MSKVTLDDLSASTGLASKFLVDIQRFLACRKVAVQEHLVTPSMGNEIKLIVAKSKAFTPRTNLMFRSNNALRPGTGVKVCFNSPQGLLSFSFFGALVFLTTGGM